MLSKSFKESAHLLGSLDALHPGRALLISVATCLVVWILWFAAGMLWASEGWAPLVLLLSFLGTMTSIWGGNAVGITTMDEIARRPPRPVRVLWHRALSASHQMTLVLMTLILCALLTVLALALLLLICRVSVLGPWLYALVLPVATVIASVVLFVFPIFVLALCAPAIWCGVDASTSLAQTWSVARQRLPMASAGLLVLAVITAITCLLLMGVSALGLWLVNSMSTSLLGTASVWPADSFLFNVSVDTALTNYATAAKAGVMATTALVGSVAGLVAIRGVCLVYQQVLEGLDTQTEQQFMQAALAGAQKSWRGPALIPAASQPPVAMMPLPLHQVNPDADATNAEDIIQSSIGGTGPQQDPGTAVDIDLGVPKQRVTDEQHHCPACGGLTHWSDFFCGECGQRLR